MATAGTGDLSQAPATNFLCDPVLGSRRDHIPDIRVSFLAKHTQPSGNDRHGLVSGGGGSPDYQQSVSQANGDVGPLGICHAVLFEFD